MEDGEECNMGLSLGLGVGQYVPSHEREKGNKPMVCLDLSFRLCRKEEADNIDDKIEDENYAKNKCDPNNNNKTSRRQKLRLTKEQSRLLEESFKLHSTLNPAQKQALAKQLNLKTRQVEVWFQNRRARTKLKQTEVDYEFLKKCCESLSEDNRRLKKELQELRSLKAGQSPLYIQLPQPATLTMCPSCEKIGRTSSEGKLQPFFDVVLKNNKSQSGFGGAN